jgi:hypothetical protein
MLYGQVASSMGLLSPADILMARAVEKENASEKNSMLANPGERSRDMKKGLWFSRQTRDKYCVRFKEEGEAWAWNISRCFDKAAFVKQQENVYVLKKETGTLTLTGRLEGEEGEGTYEFTEDDSFKKYLAENNISSRDENLLLHLFFADVERAYIEFLKKHYPQISGDRLQEVAIHGITQKSYQAYIDLFEKYNNRKPSIQEVKEAKIHGIDQLYVEMLQNSGYKDLSMREMMEASIHGVNADYINMLRKEGFTDLSINQVVEAKIHGLNSGLIQQLRALGYTNLGLQKLIELKIHGVNAAYVQDLASAGFSNLPLNKLIEAKIHGVDGKFINDVKSKGYKLETIKQYIDFKIHGLSTVHRN